MKPYRDQSGLSFVALSLFTTPGLVAVGVILAVGALVLLL